jgi:hypothetical protein
VADNSRVLITAATGQPVRNPSSVLENQVITNSGPGTAFLGQTSAVTSSTGTPFPPGSEYKGYRNSLPIFAAIASGGQPANLLVSAGVEPT